MLHDWQNPSQLKLQPTNRSQEEIRKVQPILADYLQVGALREIPFSPAIKFLIPWFIIYKKEASGSVKNGLISD